LTSIPVVAVSSFAMKGDEEKARAAGCDEYVTKPYSPIQLLRMVRGYLGDEAKRLENPNFAGAEIRLAAVRAAAAALGLQISVVNATSEQEIEAAFATMVERPIDALLVASGPFFFGRRQQLAMLAARHKIPAIYFSLVAAGGLMSYGTNIVDAQRLSGIYAGELLNGAKASDLPIVQPTKFELVINLKAAKTLGLTVPLTLQMAADDVTE